MLGSLLGFFGRSALMTSPAGGAIYAIGRFLKRIPWQIWVAIAAALIIWLGVKWHGHQVKKAIDAAYQRGRDDESREAEQKAATVDQDMAAAVNPIAEKKRAEYEEELRRIRADADALRLRGAGKAECRDPAFSTGAAGHEGTLTARSGPVRTVPYPEWSALIAMPVSSAVGIAESHDALRAEVKTWRGWYDDTYTAWEKQRLEALKPKR